MRLLTHELVVQRLEETRRRSRHVRRPAWPVHGVADVDLGVRERRWMVRSLRPR